MGQSRLRFPARLPRLTFGAGPRAASFRQPPGIMRTSLVILVIAASLGGCAETSTRSDSARGDSVGAARPASPAFGSLVESGIPLAAAGDSGWKYQQRVRVDLDADGADETVVLISDVTVDDRGRPLWEDGHRWQVYVDEPDGERTRLYARFLSFGKLTASLTRDSSATAIVLLEQTPHRLGAWVITYQGPGRGTVTEGFEREIDRTRFFEGSPSP